MEDVLKHVWTETPQQLEVTITPPWWWSGVKVFFFVNLLSAVVLTALIALGAISGWWGLLAVPQYVLGVGMCGR